MDQSMITSLEQGHNDDTLEVKSPKRRIKKLTAEEIQNLPGVSPVAEKKIAPEFTYYLAFNIPVTGLIGTAMEANDIHAFAYQLETQAKLLQVGSVTNVSIASGICEVVMELTSAGNEPNHGAPVTRAFNTLNSYFNGESVLKQNATGKPVTWKAKVNGTTVVVGKF